jgi:hypothetical protein
MQSRKIEIFESCFGSFIQHRAGSFIGSSPYCSSTVQKIFGDFIIGFVKQGMGIIAFVRYIASVSMPSSFKRWLRERLVPHNSALKRDRQKAAAP